MEVYEQHVLNRIFTIPVARWMAVMSKRWDIPYQSLAGMLHEQHVLNGGRTISVMGHTAVVDDWDWSFIDNELTWTLLFGWVPTYIQQKGGETT